MEPVQHVTVRLQIVLLVQQMEQHAQHVKQIIIWHHQHHVNYVQVFHNVFNAQQMQTDVQNVTMDSIQMEQNVNHAPQLQDVQNVHKQPRHVQHVQVDII